MEPCAIVSDRTKRFFGWIGLTCLLLIIPVKAIRWTDESLVTSIFVGMAPSALGPAGLLFLVLSSSHPRLARFTLLQTTLFVGIIAIALEFLQLVPRPGILARVHYTFDWLDLVASVFSISVGYAVARWLIHEKGEP